MKRNIFSLAIRAMFKGPVTIKYPFQPPRPVSEGFRGVPKYAPEQCTGCGACAEVCPSQCITVTEKDGKRMFNLWYGKCSFCSRCEEVCPETPKAIKLSQEYEISTTDKLSLVSSVEVDMKSCEHCGAWFTTVPLAEKAIKIVTEQTKIEPESLDRLSKLCPKCKRDVEALTLLTAYEEKKR
ncbi:MAG: 4Fe-4S dicluster domain-containing protein [Candidatus Bathyarchaeota archaeon]